ncbi:HCP-like protein [Sparassis crispa]|uniref:HCP-like protein n=1 Tax=Sparassis crispa TaxID=139825 RepID=A0A401GGI3_9APHY|nr:HCP-like protein [Sparassis crispa]GBE81290.1 HCP-like protein [Sparassis crispa]
MTCKKFRARKASFIAFGIIAFSAFAQSSEFQEDAGTRTLSRAENDIEIVDPAAEASRAYRQALSTLAALTALPAPQYEDASLHQSSHKSASLLSAFLPSMQGHGPIASAMRITAKLFQHSWLPYSVTSYLGRETATVKKKNDEMQGKAVKVIDLLQHAAELGNTDALYTLGKISLFPPNGYFLSDPALGFSAFVTHASLTGNATSQAYIGFFYATGYHGIVPVDQAKVQLYLTFAGHGGDKGAQMAMGYRYWSGIGVTEDCLNALDWYEEAADQAMAKFRAGPPGGKTLPLMAPRLSDLDGGIYGPGASVASTGLNAARPVIKTANARAAGETWDDLLEYYLFNADRGETDFAYRLGKIFYQGSIYAAPGGVASGGDGASRVPRDLQRARYYFHLIARQVWPRDPSPHQSQSQAKDDNPAQAGYAALAAGYLGRMYLRGEGVKADPMMAKLWFERGAEYGEKECHHGLGIIWRDGLVDGRTDSKKAIAHFIAAATQELAEAQVQLGKHHYERGDLKLATTYFETAVRQGSPFEAYYYLAELQSSQARSSATPANIAGSSCAIAVSFYKLVAERGSWEDDLLNEAELAWNTATERGGEMAMLRWWIAAERGFESAQNNLAFVLDQDKSILRFTRFAPNSPSNDTARLALTQWMRSAAQRNVDALVKVGDYYYHGLGVPDEQEDIRWEKAAGYYQSAADTQMSALAMWNLGWMYENGVGVPQDFHLAKRHYDLALDTNSEAYMPVVLSLIKLHARSLWHTLMGGANGLSLWGDGDESGSYYAQPESREIESGKKSELSSGERAEDREEYEDGPWYYGKARDDYRRRRGQEAGRLNSEADDPVQWARDRRIADSDREGDFGPEDYFDAATRGRNREDEAVDEFTETMLLVVLCLIVSILLYIRGRWMDRTRREQQQPQQPQQQPHQQPQQLQQQPQQQQQQPQQQLQQQQQQPGGGPAPQPPPPANDWAMW